MRISLLHATFGAGAAAVAVRDEWISRASEPGRVEHIFASDADDEASTQCAPITSGVVSPALPGRVTAVRNWNAAAAVSTGDLLVVVADDLWPPDGWDRAFEALCVDLNPRLAAFVIKVRDYPEDRSDLIRHPIISRMYYEKFGLWCPEYDGHFVDNDFTLSAHRRNLVIDGRSVSLDHRRPGWGTGVSASHEFMVTSHHDGRATFDSRWPIWKRRLVRVPLRARKGRTTIGATSRLLRASISRTGYALRLVPANALETVRRSIVKLRY